MKLHPLFVSLVVFGVMSHAALAADQVFVTNEGTGDISVIDSKTDTVILDATGAKNLRIETVDVEETDFEESIFSLGRIEAIPAKRSGVSSRIPGRIIELKLTPGDTVKAGDEVAKVESRQPGDPPPVISLQRCWPMAVVSSISLTL